MKICELSLKYSRMNKASKRKDQIEERRYLFKQAEDDPYLKPKYDK